MTGLQSASNCLKAILTRRAASVSNCETITGIPISRLDILEDPYSSVCVFVANSWHLQVLEPTIFNATEVRRIFVPTEGFRLNLLFLLLIHHSVYTVLSYLARSVYG